MNAEMETHRELLAHVTLSGLCGFSCPEASLRSVPPSGSLFGFLLFHMGTHVEFVLTLTYSVLKASFMTCEAWRGVGK